LEDTVRFIKLFPVVFLSLLLTTASSSDLEAQSGAGSIQGTVTDSSGAVIPAASILVVNVATGVVTNTKSNSVGFFQAPELFAGNYSITVTAPGMKTYKTSVELQVAQDAVINPVMTAGAVTQRIIVNADAVQLVDKNDGAITSTLENARINQLPMDGRNIITLLSETTPDLGSGPSFLYTVNGASTENNLYGGQSLYDETPPTFGSGVIPPIQLVDPDAIQEVRVENYDSGAQYATPGTAVITTKSGTNTLHGTSFWTVRNNAFGVARSIQDTVPYAAPHLVRNEFGASAGGPIVLPHVYHGKDKSFWFFAYERYSLAESGSVLSAVPTAAMRQGNYSGAVNAAGDLQVLYDPSTTKSNSACPVPVPGPTVSSTTTTNNPYCRTPFPNNTIPSSEFAESPLYKVYAALLPLPAGPYADANPLVQDNLTSLAPVYQVIPNINFRLDHTFNENNRAFLSFTETPNNINIDNTGQENLAVNSNGVNIPQGAALNYTNEPESSFFASASYTHIFSPTFFAETIAAQQWLGDVIETGADPTLNYEKMLNLPNNFGRVGFPSITGGLDSLGSSQENDPTIHQIVSTITENLTKIAGRHQLYLGGYFRHQRDADLPDQSTDVTSFDVYPDALYNPTTGTNYTNYADTGYGDASLFLGSAEVYTIYLAAPHIHYHVMEFDGYIQDNYHIRKNLTFNLGLRYEDHPALWTKDNIGVSFDLKNHAMVFQTTPAQLINEGYTTQSIISNDEAIGVKFETPSEAGLPNALRRNYPLNFLPRFGFAYLPFNNRWGTVIRGGFGRYEYPDQLGDYVNHGQASNPFTGEFTQNYTTAAQSIDGYADEELRYNAPAQFGVAGLNTANAVSTGTSAISILPGSPTPYFTPANMAPLFVSELNFTIEQPFKGESALRASYVWSHSTNLDTNGYINHDLTNFEWEMATGTAPDTGGASVIGTLQQNTYSGTFAGPYDNTTYGTGLNDRQRLGWGNTNELELNYQHLYKHGYAYQIFLTYEKTLTDLTANTYPAADYPGVMGTLGTLTSPYGTLTPGAAPPPVPSGAPDWTIYHSLEHFENYGGDPAAWHISYNGLVDLPFGQGKRFLGNANRFVNELVGGFQLAGNSGIGDSHFQPANANWGTTSPLKVYKHKYPVTDCVSGVCEKAYLWFNGYIPPTDYIDCTKDCITGLPGSYQPDQTPIDNTPGTTYYGTNDVVVTYLNGKTSTIAYDDGPQAGNYLYKTYLPGPINWTANVSLFKVFPINERFNLRLNVDAFNVFNMPGENNPNTTSGLQTFLTSANSPREIQLTARLTF
jgi:Carboxypeptidase regulatory-like domain